jgi:hypothetical protein
MRSFNTADMPRYIHYVSEPMDRVFCKPRLRRAADRVCGEIVPPDVQVGLSVRLHVDSDALTVQCGIVDYYERLAVEKE